MHFLIIISIYLFADKVQQMECRSPSSSSSSRLWFSYWGERGQEHWCCMGAPSCCGSFQSPINIDPRQVVHDKKAKCFSLFYYNVLPLSLALQNTGLGVELTYNARNTTAQPHVIYHEVRFALDRLQFHWGSDDKRGSEHTLNSVSMPLEMQLLHRNNKYGTMAEARAQPDGILAISVFFAVQSEDNDSLRGLIYNLHHVKWFGEHRSIEPFALVHLLPPSYGSYYAYKGSLTQPPCLESVQWVVFHNPVYISSYQLNEFRKVQYERRKMCPLANCSLVDNFRMPLCVRNRQVMWKEECLDL